MNKIINFDKINRLENGKVNDKSNDSEGVEEDVDLQIDVTNLNRLDPIDGGWGWMVVLGSFLALGITDGIALSYGLFLSSLEDNFRGVSKLEMLFASSVLGGTYLMMGPVASALTNQFGFRIIVLCGGFISTVSIFVSSMVQNMSLFIVTFGLCAGMGFGLLYLPGSTIVALWFRKKRATATGIVMCGSSLMPSLFSLIIPYLIDQYTLKGCLMILAGINCHCFVSFALFRPLPTIKAEINMAMPEVGSMDSKCQLNDFIQNIALQSLNENKSKNEQFNQEKVNETFVGEVMDIILNNNTSQKKISCGSLNNMIITGHCNCVGGPELDSTKLQMVHSILSKYFKQKSTANVSQIKSNLNLSNSLIMSGHSVATSQNSLSYAILSQPQFPLQLKKPLHRSVLSLSTMKEYKIKIDQRMIKDLTRALTKEMSRPMLRPDLFLQGSTWHLNEQILTRIPNVEKMVNFDSATKGALQYLLDWSILKTVTVQLLLVSNFFCMFGFMAPYQFLVFYAKSCGFSVMQGASILTIMGVTSFIGRITYGCLADFRWFNCLLVHNLTIILAGLDIVMLPFVTSYVSFVIFGIIFGLSTAAFVTLKTIVLVDVVGTEKLTNVFGWTIMAQGSAILFSAPALGILFQVFQSYKITFITSGLSLVFSGMLSVPLKRISKTEYF